MVYKIRVILDNEQNVFRDIELRENQTLWNLHNGIKSAFSLKGDEISVFNLVNEEGEVLKTIPLEDMSDDGDGETMSDIYLSEVFAKKGDMGHYQYGFIELWEMFCELIEIKKELKSVKYPITSFRFGKVPLKAPSKTNISTVEMESFDDFDDDFDDDFSAGFENIDDLDI
ncbi:MAG: hypothetical protein CSA38_04650 [Flavobacteriales bacterium]|nr:MAG: hypothetical protein CSA38_04650 [Flavobacteriales bacterium]